MVRGASKEVSYLFPLAEKELKAFVHAVDQLYGADQARRSGLAWIHEMEVMNWPVGEAIPNWRKATTSASTQLCCAHSINLRQSATKINSWREHSMNTQVGIGLGRMGANMVRRLMRKEHQCVVFNRSPKPVQELVREGAAGAGSVSDFVKQLSRPRAIRMMVPAAVVDQKIADLVPLLDAGDILIDGGNSYYVDD
jgi:NAD binding domain of 6-phosphogluconate dehydrogenase